MSMYSFGSRSFTGTKFCLGALVLSSHSFVNVSKSYRTIKLSSSMGLREAIDDLKYQRRQYYPSILLVALYGTQI